MIRVPCGSIGFNKSSVAELPVLLGGELECDLARLVLHHHCEYVLVFECPGTASAAGKLDHGFIAVAEGEPRQLTAAPIAVKETDVPPLAVGKRHQDFMHGSGSFPWKLGLEGGVLPWHQLDEAGPNAPAADTGFEFLSLVNAYLESAQELTYLVKGRLGEAATKRCAKIFFQKLNEPEVAVVMGMEVDAMRRTTLNAKPLGYRVWRGQGNAAKAADLPLLPHPFGQSSLVEHVQIVGRGTRGCVLDEAKGLMRQLGQRSLTSPCHLG
jgi:hypothetical protein